MTVTVQEAEVVFSAAGLTRVQAASRAAGKALDGIVSAAGLASRGLMKIGSVGKRALASVAGAASKAYAGIRGMVSGLTSIPQLLAASAAAGAVGGLLKMAADVETLHTQFAVLTGSAETATKVMDDVTEFAASTPFAKMDIANSARSLLAFGGSADTVIDELRMLGDIAAATGQPLGELSELYGKAKVQGRLFGEDINQLTGRGIPVIQALAAQFNVAESEVKGLVSEGQVGFPELQRALASMTGPGGKFAGMMETLSGTTAGKFSTFVDNVKELGVQIGTALLPHANALLDWGMRQVGNIGDLTIKTREAIATVGDWYTSAKNAFMDVGVVVGVVAGRLADVWQGAFEQIVSYAEAAFDWMLEAGTAVATRTLEVWQKAAPAIGAAMEKAFSGDFRGAEAILGRATRNVATKLGGMELPEFQAPELNATLSDIAVDIAAALEESRAARKGDSAAAPVTQSEVIASALADAGSTIAKQSDAKSTRGSAASVFASVQESLANKSLEVQKQQLATQKAAMEQAAKLNADTIKALNFGLG